ncbi:MAG: ribosome-associated translation inhibitor RaiA [Erysipelotrichaceae bacterium]|nr:ribosome-associated translation inhibitor RaiA [Erysipelotrichaceae bacterium]
MKFNIHGKNGLISDALREKIEKKLSSLEKYILIRPDTTASVVVKVYPAYQKIEVTIPSKIGLLRAEVKHEDVYAAIDLAIDKLEDQIRKQKTRLSRRHKDSLAEAFLNAQPLPTSKEDVVVRTKQIVLQQLELEEAILKMEMLGHSFFVYNDAETKKAAVVYKRNDGGYGLLETQ